MATLRQIIETRKNDYSPLETSYLEATGGELVLDPIGSVEKGPSTITNSVTVLIGAYNSRDSLRRTLVSIGRSSFNRKYLALLEVVLVDDGSTDGTREMVAALDCSVPIKYVWQDQSGLTAAHNTGLGYAEGDILIFCDSDIVHTEYAIEELMKRHQVLDGELRKGDLRRAHDVIPPVTRLVSLDHRHR